MVADAVREAGTDLRRSEQEGLPNAPGPAEEEEEEMLPLVPGGEDLRR